MVRSQNTYDPYDRTPHAQRSTPGPLTTEPAAQAHRSTLDTTRCRRQQQEVRIPKRGRHHHSSSSSGSAFSSTSNYDKWDDAAWRRSGCVPVDRAAIAERAVALGIHTPALLTSASSTGQSKRWQGESPGKRHGHGQGKENKEDPEGTEGKIQV